ncbi:hypothetical protein EBL89_03590 [Cereibacter sphaeroides]|uniref:hypothetical protein n=1 Tax=Cereibacter sphaeroides TaxID=1063 RepID=UPI000F53A079|nr:hypothetical protein [Cereibacter sphaeroides]AZB54448.1 hypothetical protein EBL89_03590 [Cereibacter sphaeroides]AZB58702.1 hypothetical protein EBL88_03575 [Cereibacter sphaeroides]
MAKAKNQFERTAAEAAARIDQARAAGEQLELLPPEPDTAQMLTEAEGTGRGKGKATSQLRAFLARKGLRMPEDVLAEMAGLASSDDAFVVAMKRTEQVLVWAHGHDRGSGKERLALFMQIYAAQLRALDALLPYGLAKVTPDMNVQQAVQVVVMPGGSAPADRAAQARDVSPQARRMAPPPMPGQIEQNQQVTGSGLGASDSARRTDEVKR